MREAVQSYCSVIEHAKGADPDMFARDVAMTLSAVVAAAYRLQSVDLVTDGAEAASDPISHEQWFATMKAVQTALGGRDDYWTATEVYTADYVPDAVQAVSLSLADALAGIWRDLRNGLDELARGVSADEVTWEWRFGFRVHWGAHAMEALRAIHAQVVQSPHDA